MGSRVAAGEKGRERLLGGVDGRPDRGEGRGLAEERAVGQMESWKKSPGARSCVESREGGGGGREKEWIEEDDDEEEERRRMERLDLLRPHSLPLPG